MGYTALYRKFRPDTFEDVKGQDAIVQTLKNQIKADRIGHAYLFCGTRGTGKTTVAKILAKTVNCEHPVDGSPCGECASCRAIARGRSMNVIEIDAASNNGVDNIREIREETAYSPTEGKYKVYIIDEVHMLSIGAFNALLKTLEEPPSYVIFILATTEAHKIPVTILSRCQRYDFKRIPIQTIVDRLNELLAKEQIEAEEKAVRYIARKADGGMRDALSLLDQCISFYVGKKLTYENVLDVLGAVDTEVFSRMLRLILQNDVASLMKLLEELVMQGRELGQFVTDFTWYLRNLLLLKASEDLEETLDLSAENLQLLREEAGLIREDTLIRYIRIFSELANRMKYETSKRIALEVALIKLCRPQMERDEISLLDRVRRLERKLQEGLVFAPAGAGSGGYGAGGPGGYGAGGAGGYGAGGQGGYGIPGADGSGVSGAYGSVPAGGTYAAGGQTSGGYAAGHGNMQTGYGQTSTGENGFPGADGVIPATGNGSSQYGANGYNQMAGNGGSQYGSIGSDQTAGMAQGIPGGYGIGSDGSGQQASGAMPGGMRAAAPEDLQAVAENWKSVLSGMSGRFKVVLASAKVQYHTSGDDPRLYVIFQDFLGERYVNDEASRLQLEQAIEERTGRKVEVRLMLQEDAKAGEVPLADLTLEERVRQQVHFDEIEFE